jgi:hypothetical protein
MMGTPTNATVAAATSATFTETTSTLQFSAASESLSETSGNFSITLTLSTALPSAASVPFTLGGTAVAGTDFSSLSASPLVIPAGQTSATITGTLLDDKLFDPNNRTLTFTLGTPTGAMLGSTTANTLTITEDSDDTQPTVQPGTLIQNGAGFSVPVALSGPSEADVLIPFTLGGTAGVSGVTASPLVIHAGQTTGVISGQFSDGGQGGPSQTVSIALGKPTGATLGAGPSTASLSEATPTNSSATALPVVAASTTSSRSTAPLPLTLATTASQTYDIPHDTTVFTVNASTLRRAVHERNHRPLVFSLVKGPAVGKVQLHRDGSLHLTVPPGFSGVLKIVVRASDGLVSSPPLTLVFHVAPIVR